LDWEGQRESKTRQRAEGRGRVLYLVRQRQGSSSLDWGEAPEEMGESERVSERGRDGGAYQGL